MSPAVKTGLAFVGIALVCLLFADLEITTGHPWREMGRLARGLVTPDFFATERLYEVILHTVAFAIVGVALANILGFLLALVFHYRIVRVGCAFARAIHELFWALMFLQVFGLTAVTGVLAIAIPYAGIIAKVYSEILEESDPSPLQAVPAGSGSISIFLFARLPDAWAHFKTYTLYRVECGLRSSAVLGFVGLPTLGFHLESAFSQGHYSEAWGILILFYLVIATIRWWLRPKWVPFYLLGAVYVLPGGVDVSLENVVRLLSHDIVPHPLRMADSLDAGTAGELANWTWQLLAHQVAPGVVNTVLLTMIALVGSGALALMFFPLISSRFFGPTGRYSGHLFLVVVRSTPEYILAYIFLQLWGPSMLPAIVALSLHNGGIIGHLIGRYTENLSQRPDSPTGVNLYAYEILPRVYPQFLAFLFYRWEVILRETAILGILGIHTLGFYVDSAFADIRFDRAIFLIIVTALLNLVVDALSRAIRARLRLKTRFDEG